MKEASTSFSLYSKDNNSLRPPINPAEEGHRFEYKRGKKKKGKGRR